MRELPADLRELLTAYQRGPTLLNNAIRDLDAGSLNARAPGSDWSIRDNVHHLADMELLRATRLRFIIAEEHPPLPAADETLWTRRLQYLWRSVEAGLATFDHLCFTTAELLRWVDREAWERTGEHAVEGPITVRQLIERGVAHAEGHAAQIAATRAAIGK
jgi:hypothetical protein